MTVIASATATVLKKKKKKKGRNYQEQKTLKSVRDGIGPLSFLLKKSAAGRRFSSGNTSVASCFSRSWTKAKPPLVKAHLV